MIPTTWHSEKSKTIEIVKRSVLARREGQKHERVKHRDFRQYNYSV
jgi:hypothetical protein